MRQCSLDDCSERHYVKGYCRRHGRSMEKYGDPYSGLKVERPAICEVEGCDRPHQSKGMCDVHYRRSRKGVDLNAPIRNHGPDVYPARYVLDTGYVKIYFSRDEWKYEHRYVMEQQLGRELLPHENVHHVNGNRSDNRIENLELWSKSQPAGQRVADKVRWAKEILELYGDLTVEV